MRHTAASAPAFGELRDAYPAFRLLPEHLAQRVGGALRPFRAPEGSVASAFQTGDVPFVFGGVVQMALPLPGGRHLPIFELHRGDWCVAALARTVGHPARAYVATALAEAWGATLDTDLLRSCFQAQPGLLTWAFDVVTARLADLADTVARLSATTVDQRLAALLLSRGPSIDATHQGLADELGTAREVVSRALEHFAAAGLVRLRRAHIDVADPLGLAARQPNDID